MRRRAGRDEPVEVVWRRGPQPRLPGRRRRVDRVHGLARPVLARLRETPARRLPERGHRALLADDHPRLALRRGPGERLAALAGRHDVRADVAERGEPAVVTQRRDEAAEPAPRDVLEEDALDGRARAELEHLIGRRLDESHVRSLL